jgi:hypothetical protein
MVLIVVSISPAPRAHRAAVPRLHAGGAVASGPPQALEIGGSYRRAIPEKRPHPLVVDVGRPFRPEEIRDGKLQEYIPGDGGIEHACIEEGRVGTHLTAVPHIELLGLRDELV